MATHETKGSPLDSSSLEKRASPVGDGKPLAAGDVEAAPEPSGFQWFGGRNTAIGPRIAPIADSVRSETSSIEGGVSSSEDILHKQLAKEDGCAIQYRTCSWPKTAALLFSEYICLAIMSFPWAYSVLGLVPGLILTIFIAATVLYTSLILWQFCLRHPEVRDICDIGQMLFWGHRWAWWATAVMFILNNTFIQGLHVLVGAEYLNTMVTSGGPRCSTVVFSVVMAIISWLSSLPRTFDLLSKFAVASALFTFISVILATIFAGIQDHPAGYDAAIGEPLVRAVPFPGTTFVAGMNAFLSISYTFIGQITLPSFIAEMRNPRDFPKALWACTIGEIIVFSIVGAVIYSNVGNQYMTAPAFGSLSDEVHKKVAFSFMIPTLIFLGVLYAAVSSRFVFFRVFENNKRHINEHTVVGWASWAGILFATWVAAFIIAEVIPIFSSLLSLMSSLFDSFFGFIFWGVAFFRMRSVDKAAGYGRPSKISDAVSVTLNLFIIGVGVVFLTVGTYASVEGILEEFRAGAKGVFSCASNAL
ncbi:hypothetical protein D7B24_003931 [Verticillium nonalfalfae]|uniref:Amino acid transporter transmembrane domain-containing protein n=1 Tax=Verticillium nonalfalfae TaxID=1051616 RepID=A0A3M9YF97_9PEZI|nr:uncharacterized protein D7B24_003931 [Verticillium nonalfalfae]RNJ58845.1 hypothetical protein D7B24_003931 [Verticillium nonalfalfae]